MEEVSMDNAVKLAEVDQRARSNTRRIEKLEEVQDEIRSLATSTAVMAQRLGEVARVDARLDRVDEFGALFDEVGHERFVIDPRRPDAAIPDLPHRVDGRGEPRARIGRYAMLGRHAVLVASLR